VPLAVEKLAGKTKIVATTVLGSPSGKPAFHRIAEVHFPSMQALEACAASEGGKETLANAVSISSGGPPVFLIRSKRFLNSKFLGGDTQSPQPSPIQPVVRSLFQQGETI
jgi:hypothetical protein